MLIKVIKYKYASLVEKPTIDCVSMQPILSRNLIFFYKRGIMELFSADATLSLLFGCSIDATQQQMALNFELVVNNQLFSVVLAACK
jgi:hypothetical protein